jgi:hypothetical protein
MTPAQSRQRARISLGTAGGGLVLGAFLPWMDVDGPLGLSLSVRGTDGSNDGWVTLLCGGVVIAVVALYQVRSRAVIAGLCGVVAGAVGLYDFRDIRDRIDNLHVGSTTVDGSVGNGLWLTLIAAVAVIVLSVWLYRIDHPRA